MIETEWYDRIEQAFHHIDRARVEEAAEKGVESHLSVFPGLRTKKEIREIINGLIHKLQGFPPPWLVIAGPDGEMYTPDDIWIEPAYNDIEVQKAWDLHDGRNLGTMVVAVYRWDPEAMNWTRDTKYGMLGDVRKTRKADPDDPTDSLCGE